MLCHPFLESFERPGEPCRDGGRADAEHAGDGVAVEVEDDPQRDHLALAGAESLKRRVEGRARDLRRTPRRRAPAWRRLPRGAGAGPRRETSRAPSSARSRATRCGRSRDSGRTDPRVAAPSRRSPRRDPPPSPGRAPGRGGSRRRRRGAARRPRRTSAARALRSRRSGQRHRVHAPCTPRGGRRVTVGARRCEVSRFGAGGICAARSYAGSAPTRSMSPSGSPHAVGVVWRRTRGDNLVAALSQDVAQTTVWSRPRVGRRLLLEDRRRTVWRRGVLVDQGAARSSPWVCRRASGTTRLAQVRPVGRGAPGEAAATGFGRHGRHQVLARCSASPRRAAALQAEG